MELVEQTEAKLENEAKPEEKDDRFLEVLDIVKKPRNYEKLQLVFNIFGRKYYLLPLKLINDDIVLLDKDMKKINYDIRTIHVEPFDITIRTFFNENNRGLLGNEFNDKINLICPKYQHYINYSSSQVYISCLQDEHPIYLNCVEVNIVKKMIKNNRIIEESIIY